MITDRQEKLLNFIIKEYVKTAKPVGSALVAKKGDFDLGPASLRSEMCELEQAGYLSQLHTSGGRVPTDKAYRFYVNNLNSEKEDVEKDVSPDIRKQMRQFLRDINDPSELNKAIARLVSEFSDNLVMVGISETDDFYKTGLASLLEFPEFREFDRIFNIASIFDHFESVFSEMEKEFFSETDSSIKVYIGSENPLRNARNETVMFAKYPLPQKHIGSLTLVGPTRMDYERNISLIRFTTEELNKLY